MKKKDNQFHFFLLKKNYILTCTKAHPKRQPDGY